MSEVFPKDPEPARRTEKTQDAGEAGEHADPRKVVIAALAGNIAIAICKFAAAFISGSTSTLAEAVHSLADCGNQALLLLGLRLAAKPSDDRHPFGRASEQYFWPFVVALLLFSVGGAFAFFEGVTHLLHASPDDEPHRVHYDAFGHVLAFSSSIPSYLVLGVSFLFEALSFRVAITEFKVMAKGKPLRQAILEARDPTIPLVVAEDFTALCGLTIALVAVILSSVTNQRFWDPLGSILIGVLLAGVAVVLAIVTHGLLIGESATLEDQAAVLELVEGDEKVVSVTQMLTMHLGPNFVVLALKVAFQPSMLVGEVESVTNRIESKVRAALPHMTKIFIEPDTEGDGRGLAEARALLRSKASRAAA